MTDIKIRIGVIPKKTVKLPGESRFSKNRQQDRALLDKAREYWDSLSDWRDRCYRAFQYLRGNQWYETVEVKSRNGSVIRMTEEDYIKEQGKNPFKQNLIRPIVKKIVSQYRSNPSKSVVVARAQENSGKSEMLSTVLEAALDLNAVEELDSRNLENMLVNGGSFCHVSFKYNKYRDRDDVRVDNIPYDRMIFNSGLTDPRHTDIRFIGRIIDAPIDSIVAQFATTREDEIEIRKLFTENNLTPGTGTSLVREDAAVNDFYIPTDMSLARVFELWYEKVIWRMYVHDYYDGTKKMWDCDMAYIDQLNAERKAYYLANGAAEEDVPPIVAHPKMESVWFYKFLTAHGDCLAEGETPYEHQSHPFALKLYPMLNGEAWGLVEDVIDQQRYINNLVISQIFQRSAAAKGVLIVPEEAISDDFSFEDIADEWTRYNGVIKMDLKPGAAIPQQIAAQAIDPTSNDAIKMQMDFMMRSSGVGDAMQGVSAKSGTPASLYAQESQNASTNNTDIIKSYGEFKKERDLKVLSLIRQFYDDRMINIAGNGYANQMQMYKASEVKALKDVDLTVVQGADSPVYRSIMDEQLFKWVDNQQLPLELALSHSSLPFKDSLLADYKAFKEQAQQAAMQQPQQV